MAEAYGRNSGRARDFYNGHDIFCGQGTLRRMVNDEWRGRLKAAIEKAGESPRSIGLKAGASKGYVSQALAGKDMTLGYFLRICEGLSVNPAEILTGVQMDAEAVRFLKAWSNMPEDAREIFRSLAARR